jgi:ATP-dependent DNA helicase PIF1
MTGLNEDQKEVLEFVKNGKNVFVTGGAGVGKSFLLKEITDYFRENGIIFAVTAMTGSAAILINGRTLHSTLGIGLAKGTPNELLKRLFKMEGAYSLLMSLEVLIIDEVSMLNDILFDKIFELLKLVKRNNKPFGGIQVILVGDMSQLPPVEGSFCFKSLNFDFNVKILTKNMRVQNDNLFENILGRLRWGICTDDDYSILESLRDTIFENDIVPTKLYSTNKDVDSVNSIELQNLINQGVEYKMYSVRYTSNPLKLKASTNYVNSQKIQEHIKLCIGAQVMVNRNLDPENQIVNGTRGVVTHLYDDYIVIKLINGNEQIISYFHVKPDPFDTVLVDKNLDFKYLPIQLAWSVSIHKSQGMTIDALSADLGRSVFAFGQAYTAISRAKNLSSIKLTKVSQRSFRASPDVIEFYSKYS